MKKRRLLHIPTLRYHYQYDLKAKDLEFYITHYKGIRPFNFSSEYSDIPYFSFSNFEKETDFIYCNRREFMWIEEDDV